MSRSSRSSSHTSQDSASSHISHTSHAHPSRDSHARSVASIDRKIWGYALPSLATLLTEPLLLAADTAMVGHLGTNPLAGLSLASTLLATVVGLCIFLAYATTASLAHLVGSGKRKEAAEKGIQSLWLAAGLGIILALVLSCGAFPILGLFHPEYATAVEAQRYLVTASYGLPGMLIVLAATGALRGFGDTKHPMYAATVGAVANIPLNYLFIYLLDFGVAGAGIGTATTQTLMGVYLVWIFIRLSHGLGVSLRPSGNGVLDALGQAWPLIVRTICLRIAILIHIASATTLGTQALAAQQITMTVWNFAAYGLDSLATAAQILTATALGEGEKARLVVTRCIRLSTMMGIVLGVILVGLSWFIPGWMGAESGVVGLARITLIVSACCLPIASVAYVLDGVLIGAQDMRRLAVYMLEALLAFAPLAIAIGFAGSLGRFPETSLFGALWFAYAGVFMAVRAGTMMVRIRSKI